MRIKDDHLKRSNIMLNKKEEMIEAHLISAANLLKHLKRDVWASDLSAAL